jgi:hypothetical protein
LKLNCDEPLSNVAFNFNLCRYTKELADACRAMTLDVTEDGLYASFWAGHPSIKWWGHTGESHVITINAYRCSPHHPPHGVPVLSSFPPRLQTLVRRFLMPPIEEVSILIYLALLCIVPVLVTLSTTSFTWPFSEVLPGELLP